MATPEATTMMAPGQVSEPETDAAVQDGRRWAVARDRHWTMLVTCAVALGLSFALRLDSDSHVAAGGWSLPPMCGSRVLFGMKCPGCGLTRSFVALAHGDWQRSLAFHRLGWLLFAAAAVQLIYRPWALMRRSDGGAFALWGTWFAWGLIAALVVNWLVELLGWA